MQVKITYEYDARDLRFPFWAKSVLNDQPVCTCGASWEEVRKEHIQRLSAIAHSPTPPAEESIDL